MRRQRFAVASKGAEVNDESKSGLPGCFAELPRPLAVRRGELFGRTHRVDEIIGNVASRQSCPQRDGVVNATLGDLHAGWKSAAQAMRGARKAAHGISVVV